MTPDLYFYLAHDSHILVHHPDYCISIEMEKVVGLKNYKPQTIFPETKNVPTMEIWEGGLRSVRRFLKRDYGITKFGKVYIDAGVRTWGGVFGDTYFLPVCNRIQQCFPADEYIDQSAQRCTPSIPHHKQHMWSAYHQWMCTEESHSGKALVFTQDGGGNDHTSWFGIIDNYEMDVKRMCLLPFPYLMSQVRRLPGDFSKIIGVIDDEELLTFQGLNYAGKIMGLASYGESLKTPEWEKRLLQLVEDYNNNTWERQVTPKVRGNSTRGRINFKFKIANRDELRQSPDVRAFQGSGEVESSWLLQKGMEITTLNYIEKYIIPVMKKEKVNTLILGGGGALNVTVNELIKKRWDWINVWVPPNPGDSGLALGSCVETHRENTPALVNGAYSGVDILDSIPEGGVEVSVEDLVGLLEEGKIIGMVYGDVELGPRALCHRSILCMPIEGMKDKINARVKGREEYRPFAPVTMEGFARHLWNSPNHDNLHFMSYALDARDPDMKELSSVIHVDGTSRVQELREKDNPWVYHVLSRLNIPVLLNTSFNVGGKPILNTMDEAMKILETTELDGVIYASDDRMLYFT